MKFHEYETMYASIMNQKGVPSYLRRMPPAGMMQTYIRGAAMRAKTREDLQGVTEINLTAWCEHQWAKEKRPYYSVFPVAKDALCKLKLDIDCSLVKLPASAMLVRFPVGGELKVPGSDLAVRSFLAASSLLEIKEDDNQFANVTGPGDGISLLIDFGDRVTSQDASAEMRSTCKAIGVSLAWKSVSPFRLIHGKTIEEVVGPLERQITRFTPKELLPTIACVRLLCTLCLLANDPDSIKIITPDVLHEDARRYEESGDQKYVDRARKRGKNGWLVGANWETCPHFRRPHLALRWTGKGGAIPKIVSVKATFVNRVKLSDVPTGYLDDDEKKAAKQDPK